MRSEQKIHIGMINSFNIITEKATIEQVVSSGIGVFAHYPGDRNELEAIEFMIFYFKNLEMYEKCSELTKYVEETFNADGSYKEDFCQCDLPEIEFYVPKVKCSTCNLRIKK
jgi:hypothetical protein